MKVSLIIPPWRPDDIFPSKTASSQINYWQPLGTLYIASVLKSGGYDVQFLNGAFLSLDDILKKLFDFSPSLIGIYSTTFGWKQAIKTAEVIRNNIKGAFIVVGGPYPIAMKQKCLQQTDCIDAVVTGEGEYTMLELANAIRSDLPLNDIKGLCYKRGNEIIVNQERELITNLDELPFPARELLGDPNRYLPPPATYRRKPVATVITSRGCNRRCIFCFQIDRHRKLGVRFRSIDNVLKELEHLKSQGYKEIKFIDDSLAARYHRAIELAEEIKSRRLGLLWFASVCANQADKRLFRAFKEAGCWAVLIGGESGVQKDLNAIRKGITVEQIRQAVKAAKDEGLFVHVPFLIGIPGQTREDFLKTVEFACELNPDVVNFHCLTPFPGTELYERAHEFGTLLEDTDKYTYQAGSFVPYTMTREELFELRQFAFRRFYSRPSYLIRRLFRIRTLHDVSVAARGIASLFWLWIDRYSLSKAG